MSLLVVMGSAAVTISAVLFIVWPESRGWYHWWHAQAALEASQFETARTHLQECLKSWPRSGEVHFQLARAARRDSDFAAARLHLAQAKRHNWSEAAIDLEHQLIQAQTGAVRTVEQALKLHVERGHEDSFIILEALTLGFLNNNYLSDAYVSALYWQKIFPRRWEPHLIMGMIFERRHRAALAIDEYRRALELKPDQPQARLQLANILLVYAKQYPEAQAEFEAYIRYHPEDPAGHIGLARCQRALRKYDAATSTVERVLKDHPDHPEAQQLRGLLAWDVEDLPTAEKWLQKAIKSLPDDLALNHTLALVLQELGRPDEAEPYLRRRLEIEKDTRRLMEIQSQLYDLELKKGDTLVASAGQRMRTLAMRREAAAISSRLGDETGAATWALSALQQAPDDPETRRLVAELQEKSKQRAATATSKYYTPGPPRGLGEPFRPNASGN